MPLAATQPGLWPYLLPILLLFCSNIFMTFAWYGHLKFKAWSMRSGRPEAVRRFD